ncbi:MAG: type II secretion system minor pseudopilin GspI [Janthinobacterium lividum]
MPLLKSPPPRSARRPARGFTMIEVLVALAIVAIALAAALRAVGSLASTSGALHQRLVAGWSADNALAQMRLSHRWPEVGQQSSDCSQGNLELVCVQTVTTTANPIFRKVEVAVRSKGGHDVLADLVTVVPNETQRPL